MAVKSDRRLLVCSESHTPTVCDITSQLRWRRTKSLHRLCTIWTTPGTVPNCKPVLPSAINWQRCQLWLAASRLFCEPGVDARRRSLNCTNALKRRHCRPNATKLVELQSVKADADSAWVTNLFLFIYLVINTRQHTTRHSKIFRLTVSGFLPFIDGQHSLATRGVHRWTQQTHVRSLHLALVPITPPEYSMLKINAVIIPTFRDNIQLKTCLLYTSILRNS